MNGYVATTDGDWFRFLSDQEQVDEVNFWQPNPWGGSFGVLRRGKPLFFKLRAPDNAIAGLGFFERYSELPLSLAWDAFGIKNGAASLQAVRERLVRLRRRDVAWYEDFVIGCILLSEPVFWPGIWIPEPADWRPQIVRGKTYDLTRGVARVMGRGPAAAGGGSFRGQSGSAASGRVRRADPDAAPHRPGDIPRSGHGSVRSTVRHHPREGAAGAGRRPHPAVRR